MTGLLTSSIEFLKGVGPQRAQALRVELQVATFGDLLHYFPFRYNDRTKIFAIAELSEDMPFVQISGKAGEPELQGTGYKKRLVVPFRDHSGSLDLVWFQGINWVMGKIKPQETYLVFGKPVRYGARFSMAHPELEFPQAEISGSLALQPVYSLTEGLKRKRIDNRVIQKMVAELMVLIKGQIPEILPATLRNRHNLMPREEAFTTIHFPKDVSQLQRAQFRLKYEELFLIQLKLLKTRAIRREKSRGQVFKETKILHEFYAHHLPFTLTNAQKRVIKEIFADLKSGSQMNRLLQGDVGSGKTMVAFLCSLIVAGSGAQIVVMAPTEILAQQHFRNMTAYGSKLNMEISLLTGSIKKSQRKTLHENLRSGKTTMIVGTHALLEDEVQFHNLGLAIIDEQHRFGVAQRSKLWAKNPQSPPHILVMTATPIPRTLAMTLYGDLDISIIDELPSGRQPIRTVHRYDSHRNEVFGFIRTQINEGRQVYIVYPLIEESEKLDLKHLMDGYESICRAFPDQPVSILHGKMKPEAKDFEMARFKKGETTIMVSTTVIEVGVDVPNASVMVIENAERFGLSQLHQLRGRVGRGSNQSYCILMSDHKLGAEAMQRMETMVKSTDGFVIAEADLKLRGPGDLEGTRQSGALELQLADLALDADLLKIAREDAAQLLEQDPNLSSSDHEALRRHLETSRKGRLNWSQIS